MRRFSLAASGLGMAALVSIAWASPPVETTAADDQGTVLPAAASVESSDEPEDDPVLRNNAQYRNLKQQNADLKEALTTVQLQMQTLKAETEMRSALKILERVAGAYPELQAGQVAAMMLRTLTDPGVSSRMSAPVSTSPGDETEPAFVDFGEIVVNLDEGRLNRYLMVGISLQVNRANYGRISKTVIMKRELLRDSLISYLSDKTTEDARGSEGQDHIRQDIKSKFNSLLFPDGSDQIEAVLFETFAVQ